MYSNTALRLEVSGIYQENTKVLNSLKGKPVHITLQYTIGIIFKTVPCNEKPIIQNIPINVTPF